MTFWGVLATGLWVALGFYAVRRAEALCRAYWALAHREPPPPVEIPAIPKDLEAFALQESELHAQESIREVIRERYADLQDWNLVRRAVGIGALDE